MVMSEPKDDLMEWRNGLGLSQRAAGQKCRPPVSQAAWGAWESGRKPPGLHNAFEIQRITGGRIVASSWAKPQKNSVEADPVAKAS
jgi:hypothetical protein